MDNDEDIPIPPRMMCCRRGNETTTGGGQARSIGSGDR